LTKTIVERDIATLAEITGDFNPININAESAPRTRFSGTYNTWDFERGSNLCSSGDKSSLSWCHILKSLGKVSLPHEGWGNAYG